MNLHPDLKVTEVTIKKNEAFRVRVRKWRGLGTEGLNNVEIIQECMRNGEVDFASTYNFHMTDNELQALARGIINEA